MCLWGWPKLCSVYTNLHIFKKVDLSLIFVFDALNWYNFVLFESGDDQSISIQMRGGPEPMMVTSWAQIMSLDPSYIGIYHCIATNTEGSVAAFAGVGVYKNELWHCLP